VELLVKRFVSAQDCRGRHRQSGNIGQKIAATLTSTGSTSVVLNSVDALHGDLGIVTTATSLWP